MFSCPPSINKTKIWRIGIRIFGDSDVVNKLNWNKTPLFYHEKNSLTNDVGEAQVSRVISAARDTSKRSNLDSKSSNPKLLKLETHNSEKYLSIGKSKR